MSAGVSVVVLAGGRSARFGSPKLEATLDGRPLLDHVLELARRLSDDVVVAAPAGAPAIARPDGVRAVTDPEPFGGPLVGLASALDAVDQAIVVVLAGDMPRMAVHIIEPMLIVLGSDETVDAVALEQDGQARPLPLVARTDAAREAARAILDEGSERSLRALLGRLATRSIAEGHWRPLDSAGTALADVDRPEDLDALQT